MRSPSCGSDSPTASNICFMIHTLAVLSFSAIFFFVQPAAHLHAPTFFLASRRSRLSYPA